MVTPVEVTGRRCPLPTTIWDGDDESGVKGAVTVPASEVIWLVAPESKYQLLDGGCCSDIVWKLAAKLAASQPGAPTAGL